ncbi:MAG TPA: TIR domain-containing protein [Caulobacteraceae bacterium]|nr:TIR domain-containing protein [Caulobacteraceae bacterium]
MAHDVFISHSSTDKPAADAVCALLESDGIRCWIAPRDIQAGVSYASALIDAINASRAMVLIFSGAANGSPQIEREIERAANRRIPILPFRIEDVTPEHGLEYFLSTPHWLDAFTPPLEEHIRELAKQLHALLGPAENGPIVPPAVAQAAAAIPPPRPAEPTAAARPPAKKRALSGGALAAIGVVAVGGVAIAGATVWLNTQHKTAPSSAQPEVPSAAASAQGSATVSVGPASAASGTGTGVAAASAAGSGVASVGASASANSTHGSSAVGVIPHARPGRVVAVGPHPRPFHRVPPFRRFRRRPGLA